MSHVVIVPAHSEIPCLSSFGFVYTREWHKYKTHMYKPRQTAAKSYMDVLILV